MSRNSYWICDPNSGAKALVEDAEQRNRWTQVFGWNEAGEPVSGDTVWVHNAQTDGRTTLPHDTLTESGYWRGVGFTPAAPPEPVDVTKDPALRDQPAPARTATSSPAASTAAATATSKEK